MRYSERLATAGIEPSVGSRGDSYDNPLAETIIGLYKTEVVHQNGRWRNINAVEYATLTWVDWFNHCRLLEPIGYITRRNWKWRTTPKRTSQPGGLIQTNESLEKAGGSNRLRPI